MNEQNKQRIHSPELAHHMGAAEHTYRELAAHAMTLGLQAAYDQALRQGNEAGMKAGREYILGLQQNLDTQDVVQSTDTEAELNNDAFEQFEVPRGWTTLIHGTDTDRWQLGEAVKTIKGMGLSVITTEDVAKTKADAERLGNPGAFDTTASYARMGSRGAVPVEVRIPFYREDLATKRVPAPDVADIKASLDPDMRSLVSKYYQPRHPVVPRNEQLIRLGGGFDGETGRYVEYFVPKSVAADYGEAIASESVESDHPGA